MISVHSYLAPTVRMEQSSYTTPVDCLKGGVTTQRCWNFDRLKPEEARIRRLFAPTMDNITGKQTAVLIVTHYMLARPIAGI